VRRSFPAVGGIRTADRAARRALRRVSCCTKGRRPQRA
jgi:hypothetical protein